MKPAIDSYSYHRWFGDWYAGLQEDPGGRITVWDFLARARDHRVAGVSLESCYCPAIDDAFAGRLRDALAFYGLDCVWAWGHPDGLGSGRNPDAADDLVRHLAFARRIGAKVMRICAGSRRTRPASWAEHKRLLIPILRRLTAEAERQGVIMAVENHIDLLADELVELVSAVDSPWLRVCLDTANNLRMFEDPVTVAAKLAPFAAATHVKDVAARRGNPRDFAFWPSVPLGAGLVDIPAVLGHLRAAGYRGLLALEIDYLHPDYGDEEAAIRQSLDYLRTALVSPPGR